MPTKVCNMDDRKAILNLSTYFPNDSEDYLRRMYRKHNCEIEATIKAIYEDKLQGKKSRIRRFLEILWNPLLKYCSGPKIHRWSPPGSRDIENPGPSSSSQDEVFFEVNVGEEFVKKLEEKFADPSLTLPKGFQPVIEIPVALGRQLYVAYIESVYRQQEQENQTQILNQLDKEDEEFAKELQLQRRDSEIGSAAISQIPLEEYIPNTITEEEIDKEFEGRNKKIKKSIGSKRYLEDDDRYYLIGEEKEFTSKFQEDDQKCLEDKQVLKETEALGKTMKTKGKVEDIIASAFLKEHLDEQTVQFKEEENHAAKASKPFLKSDNISKNIEYQFYEVINEVEFDENKKLKKSSGPYVKKYDPTKLIDEDKKFARKFQKELDQVREETELAKTSKNEEQQDGKIITSAVLREYLPTWDQPIKKENNFKENQPEIKDVTSTPLSKKFDKFQGELNQVHEETELAKTLKNEEKQLENIITPSVLKEFVPIWDQPEIKDVVTSKPLSKESDKFQKELNQVREGIELAKTLKNEEQQLENINTSAVPISDQPMKEKNKFTENQPEINDVVTCKSISESDKLTEKNAEYQSYELMNEVSKLPGNKKLKNVTVAELEENQTKKKSTLTKGTLKKNQNVKETNGSKQITKKKRRKQKNEALSKLQEAAFEEYQSINQLINKNQISSKAALKEDQETNNATSSKENSHQIIKKNKRKNKGKRQVSKSQEPNDQGANGFKVSKSSQNLPNKDVSLLEATNSEVLKTFQYIKPGLKEEKIDSLDKSNTNTASHYREEAQRHLEERQKLYQKAQSYLKVNKKDLAHYYFQEARKQRDLYEENNRLAAAAFLAENRQQNPTKNTIDLHYLYVKEAIEALDDFLDDEILSLQTKSQESKSLMIITGRGKHSNKGIPRIKPAVIKQLAKRQLRYSEINPGLLKVRVSQYSCLTDELEN